MFVFVFYFLSWFCLRHVLVTTPGDIISICLATPSKADIRTCRKKTILDLSDCAISHIVLSPSSITLVHNFKYFFHMTLLK